ncbi:S1C family serine protease [Anaeromyxobacter paludicola]|uniref:Serine protease n=1 Tax=Anaeromyxobacter paludicola TaxID=2918171 RepID=A0ABN6NBN7_9BACT|nr:S1C family serine protease [Anaeromyxobacter paludicola]BDG10461.1 serine protease [Anaeromyxobacter paludicola]
MERSLAVQLSDALADLAERAEASVVRVEGGGRFPMSGAAWSADGVVVTCHHGLERDEGIEVGLPGGETVRAELVGADPATDLAVLRAATGGLPVPAFAEAPPRAGALLLALSRPGRAVRAGLAVAARVSPRPWRTPAGGRLDRYVELDLSAAPGLSGSLVLSLDGAAVGIATAGFGRGAPVALPPATLRRVVGALLSHGRVRRGYLGLASLPVALSPAAARAAGAGAGLLVTAVEEESPAGREGLLLGDVLLAADGEPLRHPGDLQPILEEERIGAAARLRVLRAGEVRELAITVGERPGARP